VTLPSSGAISLNQTNTELGRSATTALGLNDAGVRGLTGQSSGGIDMNSLHGKSYAITFSPAAGSYTYADAGQATITASRSVAWTYSFSGTTTGMSGSPASGSSSTTLTIYAPTAAATNVSRTGTATISANGQSWTFTMRTSGTSACVAIDSYLPNRKQAHAAAVDDDMLLLNRTDDDGYHVEQITAVGFATRPCLRLVTKSGIALVASIETPITTKGGVVVPIAESLGVDVPVLDRGVFRWEPIVSLEPAGDRFVAKISVNDGTYAASETNDNRWVFTHNIKQ
jgi:hypothetical protein